jgi:DNA-binding phage protein
MLQPATITDLEHEVRSKIISSSMSMYKIAKLSGVSRQTIYRLRNGEGVTVSTLVAVAAVLGLSISLQNIGTKDDASNRPIHF